MISILPLISSSSSFFSSFLGIILTDGCSKDPDYDWHYFHFHVPLLFQLSGKIQVFLFCQSDNKSLQVSSSFLSILVDFSSAMVYMVTVFPLISSSSSLFFRFLEIVQRIPTMFGISAIFTFHCFFSSLEWSRYLSSISSSFIFTLWPTGTAKSTMWLVLFFFFFLN